MQKSHTSSYSSSHTKTTSACHYTPHHHHPSDDHMHDHPRHHHTCSQDTSYHIPSPRHLKPLELAPHPPAQNIHSTYRSPAHNDIWKPHHHTTRHDHTSTTHHPRIHHRLLRCITTPTVDKKTPITLHPSIKMNTSINKKVVPAPQHSATVQLTQVRNRITGLPRRQQTG